jgi:hypothetical protein
MAWRVNVTKLEFRGRKLTGSLGIAVVRKEIGGVGRAKPAQHPHIFPYITGNPKDPTHSSK